MHSAINYLTLLIDYVPSYYAICLYDIFFFLFSILLDSPLAVCYLLMVIAVYYLILTVAF